ncbi:putative peptidoglycan binding domain protein [compost metagenome]
MIAGVASRPYTPARPTTTVRAGGVQSAAPAAQPTAVMAQSQTIAPMNFDVAGLFEGVKKFFSGILNFFKNLFSPKTPANTVDADTQAIAQAYNLLPTKENVDAFLAEARSYEQNGTLGPGSPNTDAIKELQGVLKGWGFNVTENGSYDAATSDAVKAFKKANGLHQNYKMADGNWAVNEYLDNATLAKMHELLGSGQTPPTTPPQTQNPPATSTTTPTGTINYQAIAAQYKLEASESNVNAFLAEVREYGNNGTLGPDYPNAEDIAELQGILQTWGYSVTPSGNWDAATSQAIMKFKLDNGLHQTYKSADGNWAVNEYAEPQTLSKIREKLGF